MKKGYLSQYFTMIAVKTLSAVEVDKLASNQHEFNGVKKLKEMLGEPAERNQYTTRFLYLTDMDDGPVVEDGFVTWYDARQKARNERGVNRSEYRLYFSENKPLQLAREGDIVVIAKRTDDTILVIVTETGTTVSQQIVWLFGFADNVSPDFFFREELETERDRIEFASRIILENIEVPVEITEEALLSAMLDKFESGFPSTREFSDYARSTLPDVALEDGQDTALMTWINQEEILFRTLEKHIVSEQLCRGFNEFDDFVSLALSVLNRRKSRAGLALENHVEFLLKKCDIHYVREPTTENRSKPDFIFPSCEQYRDTQFDAERLTMLGVKSSCKDRWRQVLTEADRIDRKHLLTLEIAISENQTDEMKSKHLQLVVPKPLHEMYSQKQKNWLMGVCDFTTHVLTKQKSS